MTHQHPVKKFFNKVHEYRTDLSVLALAAVVLFFVATFSPTSKGFMSTEVKFSDASHHGLSIVPASCPSYPHLVGDCTQAGCAAGQIYDYNLGGCYTPSCPAGMVYSNGSCIVSGGCPTGYIMTANGCIFAACPVGYVQQGGNCVFSACPGGYTLQGSTCVATSCPAGYTLQNGACVQVVNQNNCSPAYMCNLGNVYYVDASCTTSLVQTCPYGCSNAACLPAPAPIIGAWNVKPTLVRSGDKSLVTWSVSNVTSCTVNGTNGDSWSGTSGSQPTTPITAQTVYTLHCSAYADSSTQFTDSSITVSLIPGFQEN